MRPLQRQSINRRLNDGPAAKHEELLPKIISVYMVNAEKKLMNETFMLDLNATKSVKEICSKLRKQFQIDYHDASSWCLYHVNGSKISDPRELYYNNTTSFIFAKEPIKHKSATASARRSAVLNASGRSNPSFLRQLSHSTSPTAALKSAAASKGTTLSLSLSQAKTAANNSASPNSITTLPQLSGQSNSASTMRSTARRSFRLSAPSYRRPTGVLQKYPLRSSLSYSTSSSTTSLRNPSSMSWVYGSRYSRTKSAQALLAKRLSHRATSAFMPNALTEMRKPKIITFADDSLKQAKQRTPAAKNGSRVKASSHEDKRVINAGIKERIHYKVMSEQNIPAVGPTSSESNEGSGSGSVTIELYAQRLVKRLMKRAWQRLSLKFEPQQDFGEGLDSWQTSSESTQNGSASPKKLSVHKLQVVDSRPKAAIRPSKASSKASQETLQDNQMFKRSANPTTEATVTLAVPAINVSVTSNQNSPTMTTEPDQPLRQQRRQKSAGYSDYYFDQFGRPRQVQPVKHYVLFGANPFETAPNCLENSKSESDMRRLAAPQNHIPREDATPKSANISLTLDNDSKATAGVGERQKIANQAARQNRTKPAILNGASTKSKSRKMKTISEKPEGLRELSQTFSSHKQTVNDEEAAEAQANSHQEVCDETSSDVQSGRSTAAATYVLLRTPASRSDISQLSPPKTMAASIKSTKSGTAVKPDRDTRRSEQGYAKPLNLKAKSQNGAIIRNQTKASLESRLTTANAALPEPEIRSKTGTLSQSVTGKQLTRTHGKV